MKHKKILIIVITFLIIFVSCFYFASSLISHQYNTNYHNLIVSTIYDINEGIHQIEDSNNLYDSLIYLTEIKQNSRKAVSLISNSEPTNDALAIGDLLGYIYLYIDDIDSDEINEQLVANIVDDLAEINTIFSRVNNDFIEYQDEYFNFLVIEVDKIIDRYPENEILNLYFNRKVPSLYQ